MDGREKDFRIVNRNRHNFRSQNGTLNNRPRFQASENPNPILGQAVSAKDSNDQLNKVCFKCNCKCRSDVKRCVFCGSPLKDSRNVTSSFLSSKPQRDSRHQSKALNFDAINVEATHKRMEKYCGPDTITSKGTNVGMAAVEEKSSNDILNRSNGAISASSFYSPTLQRSSLLGRAEEKINQNLKASKEARTNSLTEKYTYCDLSVFKVYIGNYYTSGNSVRFYPNHIVFGCGEQLWKIFYSSIGKIYVQTDEFLFIYFTLNMNKFANDGNAQVTKHEIFEFFKTLKREHKFDPASEELTTRYIILKCFKGDVEMCRQLPMLSNQIALVNQPKSEIDMRWITRQIEEHCQGVHNFDFEKEVEEIHKEIPNPYYQKRETFTPASRSFNNNFKADSFKVDAIIDDDNDDDDTANQIFEREKSIKSDVKAKTFGSYLHTLGNTVKNMFSE